MMGVGTKSLLMMIQKVSIKCIPLVPIHICCKFIEHHIRNPLNIKNTVIDTDRITPARTQPCFRFYNNPTCSATFMDVLFASSFV